VRLRDPLFSRTFLINSTYLCKISDRNGENVNIYSTCVPQERVFNSRRFFIHRIDRDQRCGEYGRRHPAEEKRCLMTLFIMLYADGIFRNLPYSFSKEPNPQFNQ